MFSTYIETPLPLRKRHTLCNVRNNDSMSFAYSVLASLYPVKKDKTRVSKYKHHLPKLNLNGIEFPVKIETIPQFEAQNRKFYFH